LLIYIQLWALILSRLGREEVLYHKLHIPLDLEPAIFQRQHINEPTAIIIEKQQQNRDDLDVK
jgi:hypothetical protein